MRPRLAGGLVLLLALLPLAAAAQPAVVEGRVLDATGAPVSYANVRLVGSADGAATDTTGAHRVQHLPLYDGGLGGDRERQKHGKKDETSGESGTHGEDDG